MPIIAGDLGHIAEHNFMKDTGWTTPTLLNSWVAYGAPFQGPRYRRSAGLVFVQGMIKNGTTTGGTQLFILPAGFRPVATLVFMAFRSSAGVAQINIDSAGIVTGAGGLDATFTDLTGIAFPADA